MNDFAKQFEDLGIWQDARKQAANLYCDFAIGVAAERDFGYRDQIQRAGVSVMNNGAGGFGRHSAADFARLLNIAKGSCGEVPPMLYLAEDLQYQTPEVAHSRWERTRQLSQGIETLAESLGSK